MMTDLMLAQNAVPQNPLVHVLMNMAVSGYTPFSEPYDTMLMSETALGIVWLLIPSTALPDVWRIHWRDCLPWMGIVVRPFVWDRLSPRKGMPKRKNAPKNIYFHAI